MKLYRCVVANFASYSHLSFDFNDLGLSLIYGATGSGKSTLQDIPAWVLWGRTAKDGNVDDVRSWSSSEPTFGSLVVEVNSKVITVERTRGKPTENDLYWVEKDSELKNRGKDLNDTQKLLNKRLGVDFELFCSGAYFNEFSPTAQFFLAKSKDRRAIMERVANLELPKKLAERAADERKKTNKELDERKISYHRAGARRDQLLSTVQELSVSLHSWEKDYQRRIKEVQRKEESFEEDKNAKLKLLDAEYLRLQSMQKTSEYFENQINVLRLSSKCKECGAVKSKVQREIDLIMEQKSNNQVLSHKIDRILNDIEQLTNSENSWREVLEIEKDKINPFTSQIDKMDKERHHLSKDLESLGSDIIRLETRVLGLSQLYDLSFELRAKLLRNTISEIEQSTNDLLERFFDSEFRVSFEFDGSDDLEVSILKNSNPCFYRQLSKGQRSLLRLCFSVSVMKACSNTAGVHFDQLLFDEALDGLDTSLKTKAYYLFEELSKFHNSVLVIDHSEDLQNLFNKKFLVKLLEDASQIEEEI